MLNKPDKIDIIVSCVIFMCLLIAYNINMRTSKSVDLLPSTLLPVSLLRSRDVDLNEFEEIVSSQSHLWQAGFAFGSIQKKQGRIISSYPIGGPLLAIPFYAFTYIIGFFDPLDWSSYLFSAKLAASSMVALSAVFLYLSLRYFVYRNTAIYLIIAYGLGTGAYAIASQALWQHGPGMLCLSAAFLALSKIENSVANYRVTASILGLMLALAVISRSTNIIPTLIISVYMAVRHRNLLIRYLPPLIIAAIWLLYYNYTLYGNFSGGYDAILDSRWHESRNLLEEGLFNHPLLSGLAGTWLSPSKGLLIYSPFIVMLFLSPFYISSNKHRIVAGMLGLWIIIVSILLAKNSLWWGGTSFGPRYFLEASVAIVFIIALAYQQFTRPLKILAHALIVLSVTIQTFGAFYAPCGWAETPEFADFHTDRFWDWQDTEIERCWKAGVSDGPIPQDFFL